MDFGFKEPYSLLGGGPDPHTGRGTFRGNTWASPDLLMVNFSTLFARGQQVVDVFDVVDIIHNAALLAEKNKQTKKEKLNYTFTQKSVNLLSNLVSHFRHKSLGTSNKKL